MSAAAVLDVEQMKRDLGPCREILLRREDVHDGTGALQDFYPGEGHFAFEGRSFNEMTTTSS